METMSKTIGIDIWPVDYHYVGEEVEYDCPICGWVDAKIVEIQSYPPKIVLQHEGGKIGIYEDDRGKIEDKEYYGN